MKHVLCGSVGKQFGLGSSRSSPSLSLGVVLSLVTVVIFSYQITVRTFLAGTFPAAGPASNLLPRSLNVSSRNFDSCAGFFFDSGSWARRVVMSIEEFGGIGDGKTMNTAAFRRAVAHLQQFSRDGGSQLNVPTGRWLTGSFNLTSNFTLFLHDGAVILGSQDPKDWPIIEPLPSYGRGRERLGGRHVSLIHGNGLSNVVITGHNGTVNGQGKIWWDLWWNRTLEHTRGHLVELMNSHNILISNLTFRDSPFWTIHPVYCSNVVVQNMTILAPLNAPNTDGVDPDSSMNVCIEDCYIESGDDLVAVKSGWDQYGIQMARPSSNIIIKRVSGTTPTCSGVGIGSEMSGGVFNITIKHLRVWDSAAGIRIKTDNGRGGYIENVSVSDVSMERVKVPIRFSRGSNDHPDDKWDPSAVPIVRNITFRNVLCLNSKKAPSLLGIEGAPFMGICMKNITIYGLKPSTQWQCQFINGYATEVYPDPCPALQMNGSAAIKCA